MVQKKIKHVFVSRQCACGRFTHFIHLFRCISFHSISLQPLTAFISPTSAPHSKSNSFPSFRNPAHRLFVSWHPDTIHTKPSHSRAVTCHYKPAKAIASFSTVIAFAICRRTGDNRYALFFLRLNYPTHRTENGKHFVYTKSIKSK
jgi:hypothetical protein